MEVAESMPMAHLAFLRSNPSSTPEVSPASRAIPPSLAGRPDTIVEGAETDNSNLRSPLSGESRSSTPRKRSKSNGRSVSSENRSVASAGSEDFGARTSYLEAIAMKAAVSKPSKRTGSRGRSDRSTASDVSTSSSRVQSEKWREFLDRKAAGISPSKPRTDMTPSEIMASKKVEEMMEAMSTKSGASQPRVQHSEGPEPPRQRIDDTVDGMSTTSSNASPPQRRRPRPESRRARLKARAKHKTESAIAAEELAAAKVEAMMAAMTSKSLDQSVDEVEI